MGQALRAASQPSLRPRDCNLEKPYQSSQSFSAHGKKKKMKKKKKQRKVLVSGPESEISLPSRQP